MLKKISVLFVLWKRFGFHAIRLIVLPMLGKPIWINHHGRKVWLNFDSATYYHLIHSTDKIQNLVNAIPSGLSGAIVDCGANHGLFSLLAKLRFPDAQILAVEPYHKVLPLLHKNLEGTGVVIIEKAIAAKDGELVFYTTPSSDQLGSAIRENVADFTSDQDSIVESRVPAITLMTFVREQGIKQISVLKLDIQGLEFAILEHADEVLEMTECLLLEVVLFEATVLDLIEKVRKFFPYHRELNPLPYGADLIFSKRPLKS
jgi:FkbM family methyltransferase